MTRPRLSICVATRNRADYLAAMLDSLIPQLGPDTELVILDGASTDATGDVVTARASALRYIRLDKNGGVDRDYDRAVIEARGEYCWLMTDDDLVIPGAVAAVHKALESKPSLLVVNAEDWTVEFRQRLKARRVPGDHDRAYAPGEDERLFKELGYHLSFIGAVVVDRELWLERERSAYFGSAFIHVGVLFQVALPRGAVFLAEPAIRGRIGNISYGARRFDIWMLRWPKLIWSFTRFSAGARRAVALERPWSSPKALFVARGNGVYTLDQFRRVIAPRPLAATRKLVALAIACMPEALAWLSMYAYWTLAGGQDVTTRYDWLFAPAYEHFERWIPRPL
jgi:abequosyltransferase